MYFCCGGKWRQVKGAPPPATTNESSPHPILYLSVAVVQLLPGHTQILGNRVIRHSGVCRHKSRTPLVAAEIERETQSIRHHARRSRHKLHNAPDSQVDAKRRGRLFGGHLGRRASHKPASCEPRGIACAATRLTLLADDSFVDLSAAALAASVVLVVVAVVKLTFARGIRGCPTGAFLLLQK